MKLLNIVELDSCESTNDEAWKLAPRSPSEQADFCPTLIVTHRQTKGRGRQGRSWESEVEGNILTSLVMAAPEKNLQWLPLAAGVAAVQALQHACEVAGQKQTADLHLKWPNDILWKQAKLGGILCESRFSGDRALAAVVGFGLNISAAPTIEGVETASVVHDILNDKTSPTIIAAMRWFLLREWALRVMGWSAELSDGNTDKLREEWKKLAKIDRFPELSVHDRTGNLVKLKAVDLEQDGRLKASMQENAKIVFLDQADSI
jgi:biotin-[acetyl-CoA-carboxylase] ligase BirA-like protein